ncbi:hypothetical protein OXC43_gp17 [Klebsiella phage vB_KpP_FBKp27]|uniref:Uncharacterized protein n=1 Tax=Klebsiella phage vB_KpP_FBKp27 TaxID=2801837 RepID=A0A7U0GAL5_9CAUD|nr:hypothetical protein OXC43_gp17 [Klebsiella phage vB_KpP_FBKp27]QQV91642.1 hypothetical protein vBKpPFBKp27_017 [Klebsiella phage vB_KpP_FBKp27]
MAGLSMYPSLWDQGSVTPSLDSLSTGFTNSANTFNNTALTGSGGSGSFLDSILGGTGDMSGLQMGQLGLGGVTSLLNGYLGFQNLSLAKKQYQSQLDQFNKQWDANKKLTNASLADRQAARVASNPNAYQSVDDYMKKYGI